MKGLLVIDENSQEIEISSFEVSLAKYKEYDAVIVVSTTGEPGTAVALGVRRPSVKGVALSKPEPIALKDIDEEGLLTKKRAIAGIELTQPPFTGGEIGEAIVLKTKWRLHSDMNLLNQSISELALLESQLVAKGEKLYIETEPQAVFDKENVKFRIKETVYVFKPTKASEGEGDEEQSSISEPEE